MNREDSSRLERAVAAACAAGRRPRFWLRDDDAVAPTPALDRLLELSRAYHVPVALAVIPAGATPDLADRLSEAPHATPVVHGFAHVNHAPRDAKKQELGPHRPRAAVLDDLRRGLGRLTTLFGPRLRPVLVPPWNRIDPSIVPDLPALGFAALSVFGTSRQGALPEVNATVDIIDWHGTRGCRDTAALVDEIVAQTGEARPIGLLTHHLVHDEPAWRFLEGLFAATAAIGAEWCDIDTLVNAARPGK